MVFPQSVLPVRVRIAPGGNPAADPVTWQWVDITDDVRVASGITISAGRADEGSNVDPGKCSLTLDNRSGDYSTRNVLGQYYGKLAKGTPLRVGTIAVSDTFTRTVGSTFGTADSGQPWSHSSNVRWTVNGSAGQYSVTAAGVADFAVAGFTTNAKLLDIDGQCTTSVPAIMTGASHVSAFVFRFQDTSNYYWASCEFDTGGTVTMKLRSTVAGVQTVLATTGTIAGLTYAANQKLRIRVQADGPSLRSKVWTDGGTEPSTWNLDINDTTFGKAGGVGFYEWCVTGNTNTKPYAVTVDDLEVEAIEFTGAVYEWPPRWDQSRKDATAPITASGILRRLQQGKSPLRSPISRMIVRNGPVAYWPMEDDSQATVAAAGIPGGLAASARAVQFAQTDPPLLAGAKQTAGITASTVMSGKIPGHTATGTWGVVFFAQLLAPPAATTRIMSVASTGTVRLWAVELETPSFSLRGYDSTGATVIDFALPYPAGATPPTWTAYDILVKQSGGNITATLIVYGVNGDTGTPVMTFNNQTIAGTAGSPTSWSMQGSLGFNQGRLGPLSVFNYEPPFVTFAFAAAANGYLGESAAARIARLCAEENVQVVVEPGASELLGPQLTDTFLNLLSSAQTTDIGILYERGTGLGYRPRGARYNRPVEFALNFAPGDVAEAPEPTDDDQQLKNQWTVTRVGGSSAVASDQTSIDTSGLLDDTATVNVQTDDVLPDHAAWRLATTTLDELRWPSIKLKLARNTAQIALWRAAQPFPRLTISNEPAQVLGNAVDLTVLGYTQTLTPFGWDIELNCSPSRPWSDIAVWGSSRYNPATTTTTGTLPVGTVGQTGVSLPISTVLPKEVWSTTAVPYTWTVAGEQLTVTAMTSASGSGPYTQTATVTRGANGLTKAHSTGEQVQLATPGRYTI